MLRGMAMMVVGCWALVARGEMPPADCPDRSNVHSCARHLVRVKRHSEAINLLEAHLREDPYDSDSRVLLGLVLSWEGRRAEARAAFRKVLARKPGYGDAMRALANLELWDDHPERAAFLAHEGLARDPSASDLRLLLARALRALDRRKEALQELKRLLADEPHNSTAASLRDTIEDELCVWEAGLGYGYDRLSNAVNDWHELTVQGKREFPFVSIILRYSHAWRFSSQDDKLEIEAFLRFRRGTWGDVAFAWAPWTNFYPSYRGMIDLYQSLPWALEISVGYRLLAFTNVVNIFAASLGKYWGDWYFVLRAFYTPDSAGTSQSYHLSARRYFLDNRLFAGVRYGYGASKQELQNSVEVVSLPSHTGAAELGVQQWKRLDLGLRGSYSRETQTRGTSLGWLSLSVTAQLRF